MKLFTFFCGSALVLTSSAIASDNPLTCVKELSVPGYRGIVANIIPAVVSVRVLIGKDGHAASTEYGEGQEPFRLELDAYFKEKSRYSNDCEGSTVTFIVRYEVEGRWVSYKPSWETSIRPPNEIILTCHPIGITDDPVRNIEVQKPKGKVR